VLFESGDDPSDLIFKIEEIKERENYLKSMREELERRIK
jgi:hypothetical protein